MSRFPRTLSAIAAAAALTLSAAACSASSDANAQLKKAGVDVSNNGKSLPASFPKTEIPVPGLSLSTAVGTPDGSYALRYVSKDAQADSSAYKAALKAAGFTIAAENSTPAQAALPSGISFLATSAKWSVAVGTFGPGQADGNYMGVAATPAH
jgi:hypothetical protein